MDEFERQEKLILVLKKYGARVRRNPNRTITASLSGQKARFDPADTFSIDKAHRWAIPIWAEIPEYQG